MLRALAGGALFGESWGPSPARVLALHGWERTHEDFRPVFGESAGDIGVVAPDLPGFGATPPPPEPWGSARYAEVLRPLLVESAGAAGGDTAGGDTAGGDTAGGDTARPGTVLAPAVVVGHSFGGRVAVTLAAEHPELVAALVLSGVPLLPRPGGKKNVAPSYRAVRTLRRMHLVSEGRLEQARQRYGSADYRRAQGVMRGVLVTLLAERYDDRLARLRCPVELVWADDDGEAPLEVALRVEELVPQAVLTRCGPVGHLTPSTAPLAIRQATERALSAVSG
jgi:pimeloyl-ACP methyl ester carboxylesterase